MKPSNVMVTDDGIVKLLDFGLAKLTERVGPDESAPAENLKAYTEEGAISGPVAYVSPEQVEGKKINAPSNIFSFGSLLYEMLIGERALDPKPRVIVPGDSPAPHTDKLTTGDARLFFFPAAAGGASFGAVVLPWEMLKWGTAHALSMTTVVHELAHLVEVLGSCDAEPILRVGRNKSAPATALKPHTKKGTIPGPVAYVSRDRGEAKKLDARSDIFSFGSVLYEMLIGQRYLDPEPSLIVPSGSRAPHADKLTTGGPRLFFSQAAAADISSGPRALPWDALEWAPVPTTVTRELAHVMCRLTDETDSARRLYAA